MTAPIRVLELRSVWGTGGGPDKTILEGARRTDKSRFAITVCYVRDARDPSFSIDRRARALGLDYEELTERNSYDLSTWPRLRRIASDRRIQIVHSHDQKTDFMGWALAKFSGIRPLATAHGFAGTSHNERFHYAIEKKLLASFPKVIAVSGKVRDELIRTGSRPERVVVVNNGIDPDAFRRDPAKRETVRRELGIEPLAKVIGAVGRIEKEKRFDLLVKALVRVRARQPQAVLVIVGEGSLRSALESQIQAAGLGQAIRLVGHRQDVANLHAGFDLFVQASEREGTPNAVLEAMALETPVVATNVGGTGELLADGVHGLLVPANDVTALASAIVRTLEEPEAASKRLAAARRRVETDLSFEQRMRKVEQVYVELVGSA